MEFPFAKLGITTLDANVSRKSCVLAKHQSKQPNAEAGSVCFLTKRCSIDSI